MSTIEIEKAMEQFALLEKSVVNFQEAVKDSAGVINRQTKMLEVLLDVTIAIAQDDSADLRIRRRLLFALQQVKGVAAS